tara:strand:+ start:189 stop:1313 length:1125 start_codon:yes stop_codon:yes gene_type:complete
MTGLKLYLLVLTVLFASFKTIRVQAQAVDIGGVSEVSGYAQIKRLGSSSSSLNYDADLDFSIQTNDEAITTNGRMAIKFLDDSTVKLTEHSQLTIDKYIYDPDPSKSQMALTFGLGTARFISGKLGKIDRKNISLKTPTADIAIRGTDFTATVDELGRSLIILLPDKYGVSSGEIEVITATGSVLLNKPYEATTVSVFESNPSKPAILDLTLEFIDNLLIVSPPKEEKALDGERIVAKANILDFNDLDFDYLEEDFLADDSLEFTELDINYLDVNYLEDLLDILDALGVDEDEDKLAMVSGVTVTGTTLGLDVKTQITTLITGQTISLRRSVSESARLDLNISNGYTVILIQDGVSNVIKINGGDSVIKITQEG